jgi:hypothetical protein
LIYNTFEKQHTNQKQHVKCTRRRSSTVKVQGRVGGRGGGSRAPSISGRGLTLVTQLKQPPKPSTTDNINIKIRTNDEPINTIINNQNSINNPQTRTTAYNTPVENQHVFCIYISVRKLHEKDHMNKEAIIEHILTSFQLANKSVRLLSTPSISHTRIATETLYQEPSNTLIQQHARYTSHLEISTKNIVSGNIWFTADKSYSILKRSQPFKRNLFKKYAIYMISNRLNTKSPTEIGYFIHKLSRHDTVEDINYTKSLLPKNIKPFQQEQTTIYAGPGDIRKSVSVTTIITKPEDATFMTSIFQKTFNNPSDMTFIAKNYYSTLGQIQRLQYIESQLAFAKRHRSIIIRNVKNTQVPTKHKKDDTKSILLTEWMSQIKDYQGNPLFLKIFPPVNNLIEVHTLSINTALAFEWERNAISHIAREIEPNQYNNVFSINSDDVNFILNADPWITPTPPEINFLVPLRKAWTSTIPKTIEQQSDIKTKPTSDPKLTLNNNDKLKQKTRQQNSDAQTIATNTTYNSDTDIISDLQDESRQHSQFLDEHNKRISKLEANTSVLQNLKDWAHRMSQLEESNTEIQERHEFINSELNSITNETLPTITSTIQGHQIIITQLKENTIQQQMEQTERDKNLHKTIEEQQIKINKLFQLIHILQNKLNDAKIPSQTPIEKRRRKELTDTLTQPTLNDTNQIDEQHIIDNTTPTEQNTLDTTYNSNDSLNLSSIDNSIYPTSTIDHQPLITQNESFQENETSHQEIVPRNLNDIFPMDINKSFDDEDLGNLNPGNDT